MRKVRHITSENDGHRHTWRKNDKRTSIDSGHSHPIDINKMVAKRGRTDHTHRLLKSKKKRDDSPKGFY